MMMQRVPACQMRRLSGQVSVLWASMQTNADDCRRRLQQISLRGVITGSAVVHSQHRHESRRCRGNISRQRHSNRKSAAVVACMAIRLHRRPRFQGAVVACRPCSSYKMPRLPAIHAAGLAGLKRSQRQTFTLTIQYSQRLARRRRPSRCSALSSLCAMAITIMKRISGSSHLPHFALALLLDTHYLSWACLTKTWFATPSHPNLLLRSPALSCAHLASPAPVLSLPYRSRALILVDRLLVRGGPGRYLYFNLPTSHELPRLLPPRAPLAAGSAHNLRPETPQWASTRPSPSSTNPTRW
jgi:hypothetical protein